MPDQPDKPMTEAEHIENIMDSLKKIADFMNGDKAHQQRVLTKIARNDKHVTELKIGDLLKIIRNCISK